MWTLDTPKYLSEWRNRYRRDLLDDILPFWLKHGLDKENGGVYTCVDREGNLMDSTKSVWFQGRCAFIYAFAYNKVEKRPEYLEMSKSCIDFIEKHCFDSDGRMYFEVMADGTPLRKRRYVFSECFAAIAMSEYALATSDRSYAEKALSLFKDIERFISTPGILEPKYLPTQKAIGHSVTMILINTAARIREAIADPVLNEQIDRSVDAIRRYFIHPEYKALLEMVTPEGELIDTINGRTINPGHCIETAWFLLEEAKYRGWDEGSGKEIKEMALQILDWSWDWGWDQEFGGIINFRDCKGFPAQDYSQDMKFWWPQTEAVIATLYAYEATGDTKYLEMHRLANDWMYEFLPDPVYGEWFGYLHRDGSVAQPAKGNLFKGPFHIPRMLIKNQLIIDNILETTSK
ncbi:N-acylglucosamine 2-epimerase [Muribaculaceae bacterium Isolate-104 (HZI)]|jgi:N-acylglucosamine 2-epimerase|nr:N-acylglucosamine 2-epimerase [Muribaculaceae bacterium Isolate-104 (HZI)]